MKTFVKILAGVAIFFVVVVIALNLYFTDERLKGMILPEIQELTGSEVQVERMSLTFFRTFPQFGVELENFLFPTPQGDTLASAEELLVGVELFPLLRSELSISRLSLNRPEINYHVYPDSTTNIDFLLQLAEEEPTDVEESDGMTITIPQFTIRDAHIRYNDETSATSVLLEGLNADISLRFADLIESTVDAQLASLSATVDETRYVQNLSLSLNQTSTIDLDNEILNLTEGTFSIRGLALNLTGDIRNWSSDAPGINLQFSSSSDNFGELLRLAPPQFDEVLAGLESRGSLRLEGSVSGGLTEGTIPRFDMMVDVADGYLQNPDLPDAIQDIIIQAEINNDLATIRNFQARAGDNTVTMNGSVERPLENDAVFSLELDGDVDLGTVSRFYPIEEFGVEQLAGILEASANANGRVDQPEEATFSGRFILSNGRLKYADVPRPIEDIEANIDANQDQITINSSGLRAASNRFTMSGSILNPLNENTRSVDLSADLNFDLASIKEFYPIDEDTLMMRGELDANIRLQGRPDPEQIESLLQQSRIELRNGYVAHQSVARPIEEITFIAEASGTRLAIESARFRTGENALSMNGSITNYLSEEPDFDLTFDGNAVFGDISTYYPLEPWINELTGNAVMNLNARGPAGDPTQIALNGSLVVDNVNAIGDSIPLPVTNLQGTLNINPQAMVLEEFSMNYGTSDIGLEGSLRRYLGFLEESHNSTATMPNITGNYYSRFLNLDEMIDWEEETDDEPLPIDLPSITADVTAQIDSLVIFGIPITQISGSGRMDPDEIVLDEAEATLFEGQANGMMLWRVPDPLRTNIRFTGSLTDLRARAFFRDSGFMGSESTFHQYITGLFSSDFEYYSELDETASPDMTTTEAEGTFGITEGRIENHPIQRRLAQFLRADELNRMNLDEFTATFSIRDTVLTLEDFRLTSDNIGMELEGTQHMISDEINYKATLLLPERFKRTIASVISTEAADALQRENGTLAVPVLITGTSESPQVRPDTSVIQDIIRERLREGAGDALRRLFRRNGS
ncbi:AsmA family protein [Rhodohalobacter halophilus]|uniref:AsmA family protein n=1 Tax=Rhodohalobacter halophilus TaxID=1812810 RepID=UPI00083F93A9|nr:AsmA family protein [Rhodohalobacter halophilus]